MTASPISADRSRAWVDVDLGAVVRNARRIEARAGSRLLPMLKANGYGLGAVPVARRLEALDPWGYGVATVEEGRELRDAGITRRILVCTPLLARWIPALLEARLTPIVDDRAALEAWLAAAGGAAFHVGVDTGMARGGFQDTSPDVLAELRGRLAAAAGYEGICTHFHSADESLDSADRQWRRFEEMIRVLGRPSLVHAANSAAALRGPRFAGDMVRPGIFLYGGRAGGEEPEPVAQFRARVVAVESLAAGKTVSYGASWRAPAPVRIATIAAGYADGLPRSLAPAGCVELDGQRAPIRGRITMDMIMAEVPGDVRTDDVATLWGGIVTLDEQARLAGTISYELLTALGPRVGRRYGGSA
ncbi:MAG TPA: alanine racemase [Gemmatimonadales bacterium]|nr:alanine racemase [Gemmatimonadales bacterium]